MPRKFGASQWSARSAKLRRKKPEKRSYGRSKRVRTACTRRPKSEKTPTLLANELSNQSQARHPSPVVPPKAKKKKKQYRHHLLPVEGGGESELS
jgi:hypothetical protein